MRAARTWESRCEDHLADLVVCRRYPHRAHAVEVLEDLQRAEEDA
jgi:hypothetical protein